MPKGLRKFHFSFEASGLTRFGGLTLFQHFCKYLGLRYFLQHHVKWPKYSHKKFHPVDILLTHMYSIIAGIGRVQNTRALIHNGLLPHLLGLPDFPRRDTLRDFLWRFSKESLMSLESAHNKIREELLKRLGPLYSSIIDVDTTALTVYGNQEGSSLGYNPGRRGRKMFSLLLINEGKLGLTLNFELRSGNIYPSTGTVLLLRQALERLPQTIANARTRVRADASFYDKDIIEVLDESNLKYVIVAKNTVRVKKILPGIRYYPFKKYWEYGEFLHHPYQWKTKHRFIVIRSLLKDTEASMSLFSIKDYSYRILVTNLDLHPVKVWKFYCNRAQQELLIRELKNSYSLAKIPTSSFTANQVYLDIALLAYDLVTAFKYLCLPETHQNWTISTLRRNLFQLPAELTRPKNRNQLRLPVKFPHQDVFRYAQRTVAKIKHLM